VSQEIIDSEVNNDTCEAVGCFAKATNEIAVKVGNLGIIYLYVCKDCAKQFGDKEE
jgi:hypothetical protein